MITRKKRYIQNSMNFSPDNHLGEINNGPSLTVPDQSLSVEQIIARFATGQAINVHQTGVYEFDDAKEESFDTYPDPKTMELTDRFNFAQDAIKTVKETLTKKQKYEKKKELDAAIEARLKERAEDVDSTPA